MEGEPEHRPAVTEQHSTECDQIVDGRPRTGPRLLARIHGTKVIVSV